MRIEIGELATSCSLDSDEVRVRRDEWRRVQGSALIETSERTDGYTAVYRGDDATAAALEALVEQERECCPGLEWRLQRDGDVLRLDVTARA